MNPIIKISFPFLIANMAAIGLLYGMLGTGVLRKHVAAAVGTDELRCVNCGYLLRGLVSERCPECGRASPRDAVVDFGLRWRRSAWRAVCLLLLVMLLSAPLTVPGVQLALPGKCTRWT